MSLTIEPAQLGDQNLAKLWCGRCESNGRVLEAVTDRLPSARLKEIMDLFRTTFVRNFQIIFAGADWETEKAIEYLSSAAERHQGRNGRKDHNMKIIVYEKPIVKEVEQIF